MGSTFKEAQDNFGEIDNDGGKPALGMGSRPLPGYHVPQEEGGRWLKWQGSGSEGGGPFPGLSDHPRNRGFFCCTMSLRIGLSITFLVPQDRDTAPGEWVCPPPFPPGA